MPFVENGNVAMVELRMTWAAQKVENTLYFTGEPPITPTTLTALGAIVKDWFQDNIMVHMSNTVELREIALTSMATNTAPQVIYTADLPSIGGSAEASLPNNVSWAIKFNTAARGRSGRGRNFIVGLTENVVTGSELSPVSAAQFVTGYEALLTALVGGDWQWVVYSRFTNKLPRETGVALPVISVGYADLIIDSQRRRLPGRGT